MNDTQATAASAPAATPPTELAQRLQAREQQMRGKRAPSPTTKRLNCELIEDKSELCIVILKEDLLKLVGPGLGGYRNQEGLNLTVDGEFTYKIADKEYRFHLHLFPSWARVDMVVGK